MAGRARECRGSAYTQSSAFHPVIELVKQVLLFRPEDTARTKLRKLEAGIQDARLEVSSALPAPSAGGSSLKSCLEALGVVLTLGCFLIRKLDVERVGALSMRKSQNATVILVQFSA